MNVIQFRAPRRSRAPQPPLRPPAALDAHGLCSNRAGTLDANEDRLRMTQNAGAFAVVVAIVLLGGWLIDRLTTYSRAMACIEAGHRVCKTLTVEPTSPWDRAPRLRTPGQGE